MMKPLMNTDSRAAPSIAWRLSSHLQSTYLESLKISVLPRSSKILKINIHDIVYLELGKVRIIRMTVDTCVL